MSVMFTMTEKPLFQFYFIKNVLKNSMKKNFRRRTKFSKKGKKTPTRHRVFALLYLWISAASKEDLLGNTGQLPEWKINLQTGRRERERESMINLFTLWSIYWWCWSGKYQMNHARLTNLRNFFNPQARSNNSIYKTATKL